MQRERIPVWFLLSALIAFLANALAVFVTARTFGAMGDVSEFARAVFEHGRQLSAYYSAVSFSAASAIIVAYVWPIIVHFGRPVRTPPSPVVQRRVVSFPLFAAVVGLGGWLCGCLFFPAATLYHFGRWSPELASQQVLSPLVSGFLAATTTYLLIDWLLRVSIIPRVFPAGRLAEVRGALALGVRARLLVFVVAVAFLPLFTMLGLVRAAVVRVQAGMPADAVMAVLAPASTITFVVYVALGVGLTLLLARTLTRPLVEAADALRRVQAGDLGGGVTVTAGDEVGMLGDGVNAMVAALREKDHILQTFGRVVEPSIRDQLLTGELRLGGDLRTVSVLFCDLRGFTAFAERTPPADVVAALNEFFGAMTACVRESKGFVDKFIGDAVLVVFGLFDGKERAPAAAASARRCACAMRAKVGELNADRMRGGRPPLAVAVAIHTGEVVAGRIGGEDRHEYTVIGDTVNVAARLQQLCKEWERDVLVSETTYDMARAAGFAAEVTMRDSVNLRGRREPIRVFGVA